MALIKIKVKYSVSKTVRPILCFRETTIPTTSAPPVEDSNARSGISPRLPPSSIGTSETVEVKPPLHDSALDLRQSPSIPVTTSGGGHSNPGIIELGLLTLFMM